MKERAAGFMGKLGRKWIAIMMSVALLFSVFNIASVPAEAKNARVKVIKGTAGANSRENCNNLFDRNAGTKWCVKDFSGAYVIWKMSSRVAVNGFIIVTANDNEKYPGRNPSTWILYGCNAKRTPEENSKAWKWVTYVSNDTALKDSNYTKYTYKMRKPAKKYKYYKLVVTKTKGARVMQISEFALRYKGSSYRLKSGSTTSSSNSSGSNSSGSSSSRPNSRFEKDCAMCRGSGNCQKCGGSGYLYSSASHKYDRNCYRCNASGRCTYCGGSGKQG